MIKIKNNSLKMATIYTCVFMGAFSVSVNMYGTLMPQIIDFFSISLSEASFLNITNDISQTMVMVFMLFVADKMDKRKLLTLSAVFYGITLVLVGNASAYVILLMLRVCMGVFGGLVNNLCTTYISDLYGEERSKYISIIHTLFAVGSLLGPIFAATCIEIMSWQLSYLLLGGLIFSTAVLFFVTMKTMGAPEVAVLKLDTKKAKLPFKEMLKNKNVYALCIGHLLLASTTFFMLWLPTYLNLFDGELYTVETTTIILTSTSIGMIISRVLLGALSPKYFKTSSYLRVASLATATILIAMLVIGSQVMWIVGMFIFGLFSGATFTANVILSCKEYPKYSATITAITGMFSTMGSMLLNAVVGTLGDMGYYNEAMFIPVTAIFLAFFVYSFFYKERD